MPTARHLLVASLSLLAATASAQTHYAWVGTYNPNGEGLYRFTVDGKTGALRDKALVSSLPNVAQLTVSHDGKTLYAASEVEKGVVQAWRIEANGELTALNQVSSAGARTVVICWWQTMSAERWRCCRSKTMAASARRLIAIRIRALPAQNGRLRPPRGALLSAIITVPMPI